MGKDHIQFGMPTLIEFSDLAANLELCCRLGLDFIELNTDLPTYQPESLPAETLADLARREKIGLSLHLPENLDLGAFQAGIRDGHLTCAKSLIQWASRAGIKKTTMHLNAGVYFTLPNRRTWLYRTHKTAYLENLKDSMDRLIQCCEHGNVTLLIENTGNYHMDFVQEAIEALLDRYSGHLGLTWDIGHDAESGYRDSNFLKQHVDRVDHMHLHDFDGKSAHQPLFSGTVDLPAALDLAAKRALSVVLECKTPQGLTASVESLRTRGIIR